MTTNHKASNPFSIRFLLSFFSILLSMPLVAQDNWGVGLRLGDPSGITVKKYTGSNAWELSMGRTRWFDGDGWYNDRFGDWFIDEKFNYTEYQYLGFKGGNPISIQLHYLFHKDINDIDFDGVGELDWYYGFGVQMAHASYLYNYRYKRPGDPRWYYSDSDRVYDLDFGADGLIGLEFTFSEVPISVFMDVNLYVELFDDPFLMRGQGGLGARYNF